MAQMVKGSDCAGVRRRARGSVSRLPSGALRVRVYAGADPVIGRVGYLSETVQPGPRADARAEEACARLLARARRRRCLHSQATVNELLDRHLVLVHATERTRCSHVWMTARYIRPTLGRLRLLAVSPERLEGLYAQLLRCRDQCQESDVEHVCRPLHPATVRKIHFVVSAAFRRAVRWGWIEQSPTRLALLQVQPHPEP